MARETVEIKVSKINNEYRLLDLKRPYHTQDAWYHHMSQVADHLNTAYPHRGKSLQALSFDSNGLSESDIKDLVQGLSHFAVTIKRPSAV